MTGKAHGDSIVFYDTHTQVKGKGERQKTEVANAKEMLSHSLVVAQNLTENISSFTIVE